MNREQIIEAMARAGFECLSGPWEFCNSEGQDTLRQEMAAALSAAEAAGMRIVGPEEAVVPRAPTQAMERAGLFFVVGGLSKEGKVRAIYQAMLAAGEAPAALAAAEAGDG